MELLRLKVVLPIFLAFVINDVHSQVNIIKSTNKYVELGIVNDSLQEAYFFPFAPFLIREKRKKFAIRLDRLRHHGDTLTILLSDSSMTNRFELFNFQDSLYKMSGYWKYGIVPPKSIQFDKLYFYSSKPFKYLEVIYNFGFSKIEAAKPKNVIAKNFR